MKLIGLSGAARSGKDTVGDYIVSEFDFKRYAFADPLKRAASEMFGIPFEDFCNDDTKEVVNEFWGFSPRQMAQLLGTEGGRELFRQDIWVKRAELELSLNQLHAGMVITDVRFPNEAQWIQDMGGTVIHIERPGADGIVGEASHASEAGFSDELKNHLVLNNGTLEELYTSVDQIFEL